MKTIKNAAKSAFIAGFILFFAGCRTTKNEPFYTVKEHQSLPPVMTEVPVVEFSGLGIKYECESMYLRNSVVIQDNDASGKFCIRLIDDASTATMKVKLPAGTYECLFKEKAKDSDHSAFYVYLDGIAYRIYTSIPPTGDWELTTRVPVYFRLDEPRTVTVQLKPNSEQQLGSTGMNLDYIQFVKR